MEVDNTVDHIATLKEQHSMMLDVPNINVVLSRLPNFVFDTLKTEIDKIQTDWNLEPHNHKLAGHLEKEYSLDYFIPQIEEYILFMFSHYAATYKIVPHLLTANVPFKLNDLWVNFQKKHEFNPPHYHSGICSFVIWMQIPYNLSDEDKMFSARTNETSRFGFLYTNSLGQITNKSLSVCKDYEGIMCMFPSNLIHYVNPFYTSDEYRISISGNIFLDPTRMAV